MRQKEVSTTDENPNSCGKCIGPLEAKKVHHHERMHPTKYGAQRICCDCAESITGRQCEIIDDRQRRSQFSDMPKLTKTHRNTRSIRHAIDPTAGRTSKGADTTMTKTAAAKKTKTTSAKAKAVAKQIVEKKPTTAAKKTVAKKPVSDAKRATLRRHYDGKAKKCDNGHALDKANRYARPSKPDAIFCKTCLAAYRASLAK